MGVPVANAGLASTGVGTGVQAYGNAQGLKAMREVWGAQDEAQRGYDAQLAQKTAELIAALKPGVAGAAEGQARTAQLDTGAKNLVAAVQAQGGAKTGGARGGAETKAVSAQSNGATLANALKDNQMDMLGRRYGLEAGNIRNDSRRWANLAPLQEQAAGMIGGWARQIGGLFNTLGQGAMSYGMAQPRDGSPPPRYDETPNGGWAADSRPFA
jgi:hypothetical protein